MKRLLAPAFALFLIPFTAPAAEPAPFAPDFSWGQRDNLTCGGDTHQRSCTEIVNRVRRSRAIPLRDNFGRCLRLVPDQGSCANGDYLEAVWVETREDDACLAGYVCRHE